MDVADFLQSVATPDGEMMFYADESPMDNHYSASSFAEAFRSSERHAAIMAELSSPLRVSWSGNQLETVDEENPSQSNNDAGTSEKSVPEAIKQPYMNSFGTSVNLVVKRSLTLLARDKEFLIGKTIENFGMGIGMALIFLQSAAFPSSINGSDKLADYFEKGCPKDGFTEDVAVCKCCF